MTMANDERREVAEDLRYLTIGRSIQYKEQFFDELAEVVVGFEDYHDFDIVFEKIANLIDLPTCHLDLTDVETYGNLKVRIYECSECGRTCEEIYGKYERCPHCGAEVIND